jgi:hypothetical protein
MRRIIWLCFAISFLLSSCNLPGNETPTAQADVLGTQVALKLTQTAAENAAKPTNTAAAGGQTPAARSATPPGSPTSSGAGTPSGAGSPSPSQTATSTGPAATATQTPKPSATATNVPGDPKTNLGNPAWKETFQKPTTWGLDEAYDDGHTRVSITNGKFQIKSYDGNGWHGWRMMTNPKIQNFYLEATFITQACTGADLYGLVFRANEKAQGYWFGVTCDGRYNLTSGDIYNETELIKAKANPAILSGPNQTNRVGVLVKDQKISLYINGKPLEDVTNDTFPAAGTFGYFIAGYKTPGFTYESTEIAYWNLP